MQLRLPGTRASPSIQFDGNELWEVAPSYYVSMRNLGQYAHGMRGCFRSGNDLLHLTAAAPQSGSSPCIGIQIRCSNCICSNLALVLQTTRSWPRQLTLNTESLLTGAVDGCPPAACHSFIYYRVLKRHLRDGRCIICLIIRLSLHVRGIQ